MGGPRRAGLRSLAVSKFEGQNSREAPTAIPPEQFQEDRNGRRDKDRVWRARLGLARVTEFGPKANPIEAIQAFRSKAGEVCATVQDGANWQGYRNLTSAGWTAGGVQQTLIHDFEYATDWTGTTLPKIGTVTLLDDPVDPKESVNSLDMDWTGMPILAPSIVIIESAPSPNGAPLDISAYSGSTIYVKSNVLLGITIEMGLRDATLGEAYAATTITPGAAWAQYTIPLSDYAIDLSQIVACMIRATGTGDGDTNFDAWFVTP